MGIADDQYLPRYVTVCHRRFTLSFDPKDLIPPDEDPIHGVSDWDTGIIALSGDMPKDLAAEIIIHEMLHQYLEVVKMPDKVEEEMSVTVCARAFCSIIKQNPELMEWLKRNLDGQ